MLCYIYLIYIYHYKKQIVFHLWYIYIYMYIYVDIYIYIIIYTYVSIYIYIYIYYILYLLHIHMVYTHPSNTHVHVLRLLVVPLDRLRPWLQIDVQRSDQNPWDQILSGPQAPAGCWNWAEPHWKYGSVWKWDIENTPKVAILIGENADWPNRFRFSSLPKGRNIIQELNIIYIILETTFPVSLILKEIVQEARIPRVMW